MDEAFRRYLTITNKQGSDSPLAASTRDFYVQKVGSIFKRENYGWASGAQNIDYLIQKYSPDGEMSEVNERSHNACHASLVAFKRFLLEQEQTLDN